jgi:acyl carrier protein
MTPAELRLAFLDELTRVAPDIAADQVGEDDHIQNDLGLDSMDVLNLVSALHRRLGIDIPEVDYPRIATLREAVKYLAGRQTAAT